jgi:phosphoribosyl-dephospho-CoA transferase
VFTTPRPLERHRLVWLDAAAWSRCIEEADAVSRPLLQAWEQADRPLVVTRRRVALPPLDLALGLPAPERFGRRRLDLVAHRLALSREGWFPSLDEVAAACDASAFAALAHSLSRCAARVRVYGSYGWQHLTGERYVHADSDLDLVVELSDAAQAAPVIERLQAARLPMRLDGELVLPDGRAVPWREWAALLQGRASQVLVKWRCGVFLSDEAALHRVLP